MYQSHSRYGIHAKKSTNWISIGAQVFLIAFGALAIFSVVYYSDDIASIARAEPLYQGVPAKQWVKELDSSDHMQRRQAVDALGRIGEASKQVIEALNRALQDQDPIVRVGAEAALRRLTNQNNHDPHVGKMQDAAIVNSKSIE